MSINLHISTPLAIIQPTKEFVTVSAESPNPTPITGGKNPGDLPDLIVQDFDLTPTAGGSSAVTKIHIGQTSYCDIQVKNVGQAGAWGTFSNRCYLSKGNYEDRDPDNLGHQNITDLRTGQSRRVYQPIPPFEWPGNFNITACADTDGNDKDKKITESDEGNQCHVEYRFEVVSNANLVISATNPSKTTLAPGEAFSVSVTTANPGENFGRDTQSTALYIDGIFSENRWITRENLRGGASETEVFTLSSGTTTVGIHTIAACADFNGLIPETDEGDNCKSVQITVEAPWNPTTPGTILWEGKRQLPLELACGAAPPEPDFSLSPPVEAGDIGAVTIGSNRQRIFIPAAIVARIGEGFWGTPSLDISKITKWCWNSNQTNWGVKNSTACAVPSQQTDGSWIIDIPNTPRASKGTWSIAHPPQDQEYWTNVELWTSVPLDSDGHLRYGGWEPNRLELAVNADRLLTLTANFGAYGLPGFWHPPNEIFTTQAFWHTTTDNSSGIPGSITCNPATGKLSATIVGATPGSTGRIILGTTTPYVYGWQGTDWVLPTGAGFSDKDGNYTLPASPFMKSLKLEATYDAGAKRLTLTIPSINLVSKALWNADNPSLLTTKVVFQTWIGSNRFIPGTVKQSSDGVVTVVFEDIGSGEGGSMYDVKNEFVNGVATQAWQNIPNFNFGSGIIVTEDKGAYVMPSDTVVTGKSGQGSPDPVSCLLNWAESAYSSLLSPAGAVSQFYAPYTYRYYPNSNAYAGVSSENNHVYYLGPDGVLQDVGDFSAWMISAHCK